MAAQVGAAGSPGWNIQIPQIALKEDPADPPSSMVSRIPDGEQGYRHY
jgi:hypothetical protein